MYGPAKQGHSREVAMSVTAERKHEIVEEYRQNDQDTGSPDIQVAILTQRIQNLTEHLKGNRHDHASRKGLRMMVSKRSRLLKYLANTDRQRYLDLIGKLGLRH